MIDPIFVIKSREKQIQQKKRKMTKRKNIKIRMQLTSKTYLTITLNKNIQKLKMKAYNLSMKNNKET